MPGEDDFSVKFPETTLREYGNVTGMIVAVLKFMNQSIYLGYNIWEKDKEDLQLIYCEISPKLIDDLEKGNVTILQALEKSGDIRRFKDKEKSLFLNDLRETEMPSPEWKIPKFFTEYNFTEFEINHDLEHRLSYLLGNSYYVDKFEEWLCTNKKENKQIGYRPVGSSATSYWVGHLEQVLTINKEGGKAIAEEVLNSLFRRTAATNNCSGLDLIAKHLNTTRIDIVNRIMLYFNHIQEPKA
jgi:hypothetical protein